jgi:hypothetical protein
LNDFIIIKKTIFTIFKKTEIICFIVKLAERMYAAILAVVTATHYLAAAMRQCAAALTA